MDTWGELGKGTRNTIYITNSCLLRGHINTTWLKRVPDLLAGLSSAKSEHFKSLWSYFPAIGLNLAAHWGINTPHPSDSPFSFPAPRRWIVLRWVREWRDRTACDSTQKWQSTTLTTLSCGSSHHSGALLGQWDHSLSSTSARATAVTDYSVT